MGVTGFFFYGAAVGVAVASSVVVRTPPPSVCLAAGVTFYHDASASLTPSALLNLIEYRNDSPLAQCNLYTILYYSPIDFTRQKLRETTENEGASERQFIQT